MEDLKLNLDSSSSDDEDTTRGENPKKSAKRPLDTSSKYSALYEAAEKGDIQALSRIVSARNVNLNSKSGGHGALRTALHGAAGYGQWQATRMLLKAGADPHCQSDSGRTALHEACAGGHGRVVEELLRYLTDTDMTDSHQQTAAHAAAFHGEVDCLRLLIGFGSDMEIEDRDGCTVAHLAAIRNHPGIIRCLIEEDVELNCLDKDRRTPAHHAAICGGLETLRVLAHNDLDVNTKDADGCVPAHYVAMYNSLGCLQFLISSGLAKIEVRDKTGRGLLHMAAIRGSTECIHWLLEHRVNPNVRDGSAATPAHYAATGGHAECISCLIKHNAEIDVQTPQGLTPLVFAKKAGKVIPFENAVAGTILCPFCVAKQQKIEYDFAHQLTPVEKSISDTEAVIFVHTEVESPVLDDTQTDDTTKNSRAMSATSRVQTSSSSKSGKQSPKNPKHQPSDLPKRDLATKYFGDHLFSLPEVLRKQSAGKKSGGKPRITGNRGSKP